MSTDSAEVPTGVDPAATVPTGKLFVGQVPAVCTEDMLRPVFTPFGQIVEIKIMRDAPGGRSKGCAWVKYISREHAQAAIDALHEKYTIPPQTNTLQVRFGDDKPTNRNRDAAGPAVVERRSEGPHSVTAFVGNLPANLTVEELREFIVPLLPEELAPRDVNIPTGKLFGFLTFATGTECNAAVTYLTTKHAGTTLHGNTLRIQCARPRVPTPTGIPTVTAGGAFGPREAGTSASALNAHARPFPMVPAVDPYFFGRGPNPYAQFWTPAHGMPSAFFGQPAPAYNSGNHRTERNNKGPTTGGTTTSAANSGGGTWSSSQ